MKTDKLSFLKKRAIESSCSLVSEEDLCFYEREVGVSFGSCLKEYLSRYGYIAYRHIELLGISERFGFESNLVTVTKILHQTYPETYNLIAVEALGEEGYAMVDSFDNMYRFYAAHPCIRNMHTNLEGYIFGRMQDADLI